MCTIVALLIGWLAMCGGVMLVWPRTLSPWEDVSTLAGRWSFVSGELYHGYLFALPPAGVPPRLVPLLALMTWQFTPIGALFALIGAAQLRRARRDLALTSLLSLVLVALSAIGYNAADLFVSLTVALPLGAAWLAFGLSQLAHDASAGLRAAAEQAAQITTPSIVRVSDEGVR